MADTYSITGMRMDDTITADPMGKPLGKQAAIVLAYYKCETTHEMLGIIKNNEAVVYVVEFDKMIGKPYLIPMVDQEVTAHIHPSNESYYIFFQGYMDVREYINLHDGLSWDKDAFQKYHHAVICANDRAALDGFIEFLTRANVILKWHE